MTRVRAQPWVAKRFMAPGCEPVCCDGNAPLPFARGAFGLALCTDALMYLWTKRLFVGEIRRAESQLTFQTWQLQQLLPPQ